MGKRIILITILLACIPILFMLYQINNYYSYKYYNDQKIWNNSNNIKEIERNIDDKKRSIEQEKNNNNEMVKLLEIWKKRIEELD